VSVLDWDIQLQSFDLLDEILSVIDHMSCAHAFAGFDRLLSRRRRHNCRKVEDVAGHLNGSAANSATAVDLVAGQPFYTRIPSTYGV
jgi:hypothetical protein